MVADLAGGGEEVGCVGFWHWGATWLLGQNGGTMGMKRHSSSFGGSVVGVFGLKFLPMVVINIFEGE
jgi:hypothetical protein